MDFTMPEHVTPEYRAELRELHAAATDGAWKLTREESYDHINGPVDYLGYETSNLGDPEAEVELIVAAVNALPTLLDEIDVWEDMSKDLGKTLVANTAELNGTLQRTQRAEEALDRVFRAATAWSKGTGAQHIYGLNVLDLIAGIDD